MMHIRIATDIDREDILNTYLCAFDESERDIVAELAVDLLAECTTPETISLVAESDCGVVGHIAFSPATIDGNDTLQCYNLAPLAVKPDVQKQGVGSKLIETGMDMLSKAGVHILFVYGDPKYYGRFGFNAEQAEQFIPPHKLQYPFGWQAIHLNPFSGKILPGKMVCTAPLDDPTLW